MAVDLRVIAPHHLDFSSLESLQKDLEDRLGLMLLQNTGNEPRLYDARISGPDQFQVEFFLKSAEHTFSRYGEVRLLTDFRYANTVKICPKVIILDEFGLGRFHRFMEILLTSSWKPEMDRWSRDQFDDFRSGVVEYLAFAGKVCRMLGEEKLLFLNDSDMNIAVEYAWDGHSFEEVMEIAGKYGERIDTYPSARPGSGVWTCLERNS